MKVSSDENSELSKVPYFKHGVGQNIALLLRLLPGKSHNICVCVALKKIQSADKKVKCATISELDFYLSFDDFCFRSDMIALM